MSVGKPTEGKLGLVREKRGDREVGIIAIAYPTSLFPLASLQTPIFLFI